MRFMFSGLAVLALVGCHHAPSPRQDARYIGLDVTTYRHTCPAGIMHVEEYTDRRIGECLLLPKRYAVFNAGKVVSILSTEQLAASIETDICPNSAAGQKCSDGIRQTLAERENEKSVQAEEYLRALKAKRAAQWADAMSSLSISLAANQAALAASQPKRVDVRILP